MIPPIPQMDRQLQNFFPADLEKGAGKIFKPQVMQPVLLGLLPAPIDRIAGGSGWSPETILHPNEIAVLGGYRFAKRRSEYLTGRLCAKIAVKEFLQRLGRFTIPALRDIEITKGADGRPEVLLHQLLTKQLNIDISISHSGDYGSALASGVKCGIDLQRQEPSLLRVQERYCNTTEFRLLETYLKGFDTVARLALLWAAKEAAKKVLSHWRMPGFLDLQLLDLGRLADCFVFSLQVTSKKEIKQPGQVKVAVMPFKAYALAICLLDEEPANA